MPSPDEKPVEICEDEKGELIEINCTRTALPVHLYLRRSLTSTAASPTFKVMSGEVKQDMTLVNKACRCKREDGPHLHRMRQKKTTEVPVIGCGDIGAVSSWLPQDRRYAFDERSQG